MLTNLFITIDSLNVVALYRSVSWESDVRGHLVSLV